METGPGAASIALGGGARAAVGQIDQHPRRRHVGHEFAAEIGEAAVARRQTALAHEVGQVVGKLHDLDALGVEFVHAGQVRAEHDGVLKAHDQGQPAGRLRRLDLADVGCEREHVGMRLHLAPPVGQVLQRPRVGFVGGLAAAACGHVHRCDPGRDGVAHHLVREGIADPVRDVEGSRAGEGVDDDGAIVSAPAAAFTGRLARP